MTTKVLGFCYSFCDYEVSFCDYKVTHCEDDGGANELVRLVSTAFLEKDTLEKAMMLDIQSCQVLGPRGRIRQGSNGANTTGGLCCCRG